MNVPIPLLPYSSQIVDICFYNTFNDMRKQNKVFRLFYVLRIVIILLNLIYHLTNDKPTIQYDAQTYDLITVLFIMIIISNLGTLLFNLWAHYRLLNNKWVVLEIAQHISHFYRANIDQIDELNSFHYPFQGLQVRVSRNIYQYNSNLTLNDVDLQYQKRAQRNCMALIQQNINQFNRFRHTNQFFNLLSLVIFFYSIVVMSRDGSVLNGKYYGFIIGYIFSEVATRLFIYLVLLIIAISPLLCLAVIIYSCFYKKDGSVVLPPTKDATLDIIRQCEGDCPICFQSINQNEKVVVLKCSTKHVFHEICITGWIKIGRNCPICRQEISS